MSESDRGKSLYDYIVKGDSVPNSIMAGVIKEELLSRVSEKGYSVQVKLALKCSS
jgi:hypothetical protein